MQRIVTEQEFLEWTNHSVTKAFLKSLQNNREELKENIVVGLYDEKQELEVKGICKSVINILEMSYEQVMEGLRYGK